jgi:glutathione S-transferase
MRPSPSCLSIYPIELTKPQLQPPILPRPDLAKLGIHYRRIPLLSIGRDIYLDTRLIIAKLENLYPSLPRLGASSPEQKAIERLLESLIIDGGVFPSAAKLLPTNLPLLKDPKFQRDRADFMGGKMSAAEAAALRPEALGEVVRAMEVLEEMLADGRRWVLGTDKPGLGDVEAVWVFDWLVGLPGALTERAGEGRFPKVYAWIRRFAEAVKEAGKRGEKVRRLKGDEAREVILKAAYNEEEGVVDEGEPVVGFHGLKKGTRVAVWPTDTGANHKDVGRLVSVDGKEVVIETVGEGGEVVRLHAPRHGFRVRPVVEEKASL